MHLRKLVSQHMKIGEGKKKAHEEKKNRGQRLTVFAAMAKYM